MTNLNDRTLSPETGGTTRENKPNRRAVPGGRSVFVSASAMLLMLGAACVVAACSSGASRVGALGKARAGAMASSVSERVEKRLGPARRVEVIVEPGPGAGESSKLKAQSSNPEGGGR